MGFLAGLVAPPTQLDRNANRLHLYMSEKILKTFAGVISCVKSRDSKCICQQSCHAERAITGRY